jgi:branched-chain amino acid transport system ATP-binding protein
MLKVNEVFSGYGNIKVLKGVSLEVPDRAIVTLLGANGAGKTTSARTITGLTAATAGTIEFDGTRIEKLGPDRMIGIGIALVPQGRMLFPELTVDENLQLGAYSRKDSAQVRVTAEKAYAQFPILKEKYRQDAGTLSGGQQQMLAIARAMLILDEPSLGLAPRIVQEIFDTIVQIRQDGCAILLVEQNANMALGISDSGYVMESGRVTIAGSARDLAEDPRVQQAYLGHSD